MEINSNYFAFVALTAELKRAKSKIQQDRTKPTGSIRARCRFGWAERREHRFLSSLLHTRGNREDAQPRKPPTARMSFGMQN
jgi:hypothetical protein